MAEPADRLDEIIGDEPGLFPGEADGRDPFAEDPRPESAEKKKRPPQAETLVKIAESETVLFHTPDGIGYADIAVDRHRETWPVKSNGFRLWLKKRYYEETRGVPNGEAFHAATGVIEARAVFDGPECPVFLRTASHEDRLYIDLADADWRVVEVDATGWRVVAAAPVRFRRPSDMLPLPMPVKGSVKNLLPFLNLKAGDGRILAVAWLLAAMRPTGPYPLLALAGEQGSGKSGLSRMLRSLVDPAGVPLRAMPRDERDFFIAANRSHVLAFDNLSGISAAVSDVLCKVATGGGFATRTLYSDDEETTFQATRPVILNGIDDVVTRPDLADRSIMLTLEPIPEDQRKPESELRADFESARPGIFGGLLDALSTGMRNLPSTRLDRLPRMADFALWVTACEPALWRAGAFMRAYGENREDVVVAVIEADPVAVAVHALVQNCGTWTGTASELLMALTALASGGRSWPATAKVLAGRLKRAAPALRKTGVEVVFDREAGGNRTRLVTLTANPENMGNLAPRASRASQNRDEPRISAGFNRDASGTQRDATGTHAENLASRPNSLEMLDFNKTGPKRDARDAPKPAKSGWRADL